MIGNSRRFWNITSSLSQPAQWLVDWFRGPESDSGVQVTVDSALAYSPVWYAVSKIAGHVGVSPLNLHRMIDQRGSELATTHPVYRLMKHKPNKFQTAIVFKENLMLHALLTGNGRAAIVRRGGVPVELIPLLPNCTYTCLVEGEKWHVVTCGDDDRLGGMNESAYRDGKVYKFRDEDVLHIPGIGYDGFAGRSLITVAKDAIGLGLAAEKAASSGFKNPRPGVVIEAPPGAFRDDKDAKEFIDNFNDYHEGVDNAGRASLMREGMKLSVLGISAQEAQWIEQRKFQRQEVALLFGLESILGDDESVSYNSLEHKNLAYLSNCLNKWLKRWEEECEAKLLNERGRRGHFFKFDTSELLRVDLKSKVESFSLAINSRMMNPNEARQRLNIGLNPYEGGDEFANPAITPGSPGTEQDADGMDEEMDDSQTSIEDANRRAVVARMRHLIGVEAHRARDAAKRHPNFMDWIEKFYGKWETTLSHAVAEFGGDPKSAKRYCVQSKNELLEISGTVTQEGLPAAVAEVVESWPNRAERLADYVLSEGLCDV